MLTVPTLEIIGPAIEAALWVRKILEISHKSHFNLLQIYHQMQAFIQDFIRHLIQFGVQLCLRYGSKVRISLRALRMEKLQIKL